MEATRGGASPALRGGALALPLEAVFIAVLAWRWYGEVPYGRVKTAVALRPW